LAVVNGYDASRQQSRSPDRRSGSPDGGISSVLAAAFCIAALNANMQSNIFGALSFGKEMSALQSKITQQTETNRKQAEATAALLEKLQNDTARRDKNPPTSD
jgi:hypothetical protein